VPVSARVARASSSSLLALVGCALRAASSTSPPGVVSLKSSVRISSGGSGGSEVNSGCIRSVVPAMRRVTR
jgi:hypothetical protein